MLKEKILGQRITLQRPLLNEQTAQIVFSSMDRCRKDFSPWLDWVDSTISAEDTFRFLEAANQDWNDQKQFVYAIFFQNKFIGLISVTNISIQHKRAEIGYWLDTDFSGRGFMREAVSLIEKELFENDFNRIIIQTDVLNVRSANVAQKCGYIHEGVLRQERYSEKQGRFRDTNMFSKLKSDLTEGGI
ncbi:MAG: GNAT family N-acetyltransferase [Alphaproteobacteria bacterium]|nr:GNAT family N-acetyltransferase [Alphaproteobacteria bacterium]